MPETTDDAGQRAAETYAKLDRAGAWDRQVTNHSDEQAEVKDALAAAIRDAVTAERARIVTIINDCEPADVYMTDESGEERPEPIEWGQIRTTLLSRIGEGDTAPA